MAATGPELPPFLPGQYMEARQTGATTDAHLVGQEHEGKEFWFLDYNWASTSGIKPLRSNIPRKLRIMRNVSGNSLKGKRLCMNGIDSAAVLGSSIYGASSTYTAIQPTTGPLAMSRTGGLVRLEQYNGYPIDEFLPTAGVPHGALFYVVVSGPATVLTDGADIMAGQWVGNVATATTAASTDNTGGKLSTAYALTTTALSLGLHLNVLGRSLSTAISAADADVLVNVQKVYPW